MVRTPPHRRTLATMLAAAGAILVGFACFALTLNVLAGMEREGAAPTLLLGIPLPAAGLSLATLVGGFAIVHASSLATVPSPRVRRPLAGTLMVSAAAVGLVAAWALTVDKVVTLSSPGTDLACNFSLLVQCGANLTSWQGSLLGFPNPLLGLVGWSAVAVVGISMARGIRLTTGLWIAFTVGMVAAMALVVWLIFQSIFVLGTLCPWCMVTWSVTIPLFWYTIAELAHRAGGPRLSTGGAHAARWWPLPTVVSYLVIAVAAQARLDVIAHL